MEFKKAPVKLVIVDDVGMIDIVELSDKALVSRFSVRNMGLAYLYTYVGTNWEIKLGYGPQ